MTMKCLRWDDGTRSKEQGTDLASVARTLTDEDLAFWLTRLEPYSGDRRILEAEAARRHPDFVFGPLFRDRP
jgi:hypothetical protein